MEIIDLGLIPYGEAVEIQLERLEKVTSGEDDGAVYLLEHPKVVTLGRQGGLENLLVDETGLKSRGIDVVQTTRGGNITCHFPGQLVAYPIIRVEKRPGGIRKFFSDLEESVIRTCAAFGVQAQKREGHPGVWLGQRKICSIGIGVRRWVTYHGLALNVEKDLSLFQTITPCGIQGAVPTSISLEAGQDVSVKEAKDVFKREFTEIFANPALA